jgi:serine phosphatase RsbU (regulator of sigma subunit)
MDKDKRDRIIKKAGAVKAKIEEDLRTKRAAQTIYKQIQIPLVSFIVVQIFITAVISAFLVGGMSAREAMRRVSDEAELTACEMEKYEAIGSLVEYWFDNAQDFDPIYDKDQRDKLEMEFRTLHPEIVHFTDLTDEEFEHLSDEDKYMYARLCHSLLSDDFDMFKRSLKLLYVFCFKVGDNDDQMHFLITGSNDGEKRISQGGELYDIGTTVHFQRGKYSNLEYILKNSHIKTDSYLVDIEGDMDVAGAWQPVYSGDEICAIIGVSETYIELTFKAIPTVAVLIIAMVLIFIFLDMWILHLLKKNVVAPVKEEEEAVVEYMVGKDTASTIEKLDKIRSKNEIESLARNFSSMVEELHRHVEHIREMTVEQERIGTELNVAKQIQAGMLPSVFPPYPDRHEFDLYASMAPAKEVGGDFYDFFFVDEDRIMLVIGDVSGKGVPAALFMAISKTIIRNRALTSDSLSELIEQTNKTLCENNEESMFVTIWIALINLKTGKVKTVNAGHEDPAIRRAGGSYELDVYPHDVVLGLIPDAGPFVERVFMLEPGDSIFVYTDGVPEAVNPKEEFLGCDRMIKALNTDPDRNVEDTIEGMTQSIADFASGADRFDDVTMLCFKYFGADR